MRKFVIFIIFVVLVLIGITLLYPDIQAPFIQKDPTIPINEDTKLLSEKTLELKKSATYRLGKAQPIDSGNFNIPLYLEIAEPIFGFSGSLNTDKCSGIVVAEGNESLISSQNINESEFRFSIASASPFDTVKDKLVIYFTCEIENPTINAFNILFESFEEVSL